MMGTGLLFLIKTRPAESHAAQWFQKKIFVTARWARHDEDEKKSFITLAADKYLIFLIINE